VDVVADCETVTRSRTAGCGIEDTLEVVLGDLDVGELVVVVGVLRKSVRVSQDFRIWSAYQVKVRNNVTQVLQDGLARSVAGRVRWTHICWVLSDDVSNSHFVLDHLVVALSISDDGEILMTPRVTSDLMTLGDHSLDDVGPRSGGVDGAFTQVVAGDEEGGLEAICGKLIENLGGVKVRAAIMLVRRFAENYGYSYPSS
jgi:hypothetical protein